MSADLKADGWVVWWAAPRVVDSVDSKVEEKAEMKAVPSVDLSVESRVVDLVALWGLQTADLTDVRMVSKMVANSVVTRVVVKVAWLDA